MSGRRVERIEMAVDAIAAALFAAAIGFCVLSLLRSLPQPQPEVAGAAAFIVSFLLCGYALQRVVAVPRTLVLPRFEPVPAIKPADLDELVLTSADRLHPAELLLTDADRLHPEREEPLILDDILAKIEPDSRVVRLFDPSAVPTPGQLKDRIDRHLDEGTSPAASEDAAQALFEALAQLRRTLA